MLLGPLRVVSFRNPSKTQFQHLCPFPSKVFNWNILIKWGKDRHLMTAPVIQYLLQLDQCLGKIIDVTDQNAIGQHCSSPNEIGAMLK